MSERCPAIALANEYSKVSCQCERPIGHPGPHVAELGPSSRRIWGDVTFPINFNPKEAAPWVGGEKTSPDVLADVQALIQTMQEDQKYGPYRIAMPLEKVRDLNPKLAAEIEAAGPGILFWVLLDGDGYPTRWERA